MDEYDEIGSTDRPDDVDFDHILDNSLSRRSFLKNTTMVVSASAFVMSTGVPLPSKVNAQSLANARVDFTPVKANTLDTVTLPKGFSWSRVVSWGDPMWSNGQWLNQQTGGNAKSQALAFGDNNDGMEIFTKDGKTILAVNNEYPNLSTLYKSSAGKPQNIDDINKAKAAVGVSIIEIKQQNKQWSVVKNSQYNRKITAQTPMTITGPAKAHTLVKTDAEPTGTQALGTFNNCGSGKTPWGTYLTCEENFDDFFSSQNKNFKPSQALVRYGVSTQDDRGYGWGKYDNRFDIAKNPNEPNRVGYVVEIDPLNPNSTPKKRTALGRFKHENAEVVIANNGHVVVYLGDDERGEYLYKFISKNRYDANKDNSDLLAEGDLFVAKFNNNGTGRWLKLTPQNTGLASQAEVCIHTRIAASVVKGTTMDRPEWVAANPHKAEIYCSLTNNKNRGKKTNKGGDALPIDALNSRVGNQYGQIVRWQPKGGNHTNVEFNWNLFALAGNPTTQTGAKAGSDNITADNMFNSPDGLRFDSKGRLWIQTDGNYSNRGDFAGMGNNQMLLGNPRTGEIKRFMVGPKECEITGLSWSQDKKTMFVGIQHPGERGGSHFPDGGNALPKSSIIAITRDDGGILG